MVPPEELPTPLRSTPFPQPGARVRRAVGGVLAAVLGLALCFTCNAISFAAVIVSLALMNGALLYPARPVRRRPGQIREGLRYVRDTPQLLIPLLMIALVGTLAWEFPVTLPLMASDVFGGGAGAYGVMASVMGVGAVGGGLISAARPGRGRVPCASRRSAGGSRSRPPPSPRRCRLSWPPWCSSGTAASRSTPMPRQRFSWRPSLRCAGASWRSGPWPGRARPRSAARSSAGSRRIWAPGGRWWRSTGSRLSSACWRCPRSPASTGRPTR